MWQAVVDGLSVLSDKWPVVSGAVIVVCLGYGANFHLFRTAPRRNLSLSLSVLLIAFSVIVRLAFIEELYVPPYFDSVEHYRIVKELIGAFESSTLLDVLPKVTPDYYHLGFHFLASLLAFGLHANPIDVILVFGQIILAALPVPIFFIILHETRSIAAAFFGSFLAGFGWYMPGYAVNWGKYPALAGLLAFEIVLGMAYFISKKKPRKHQYATISMLILGILISTLIHSRTLIILFLSFASWILASRILELPKKSQWLVLGILILGIITLVFLIQSEPLLKLTLEPYLEDGILITIIILALIPFALCKYSWGVYFNLLFVLGLFTCLFIPVGTFLPGLGNQTLLDRPFVEMVLYLPLSILGGLGIAGAKQFVSEIKLLPERIRVYTGFLTTALLIGFVGTVSMRNYNFYPSDCCNFLKYDDTVALDWLEINLPPDARILIATTELNVLPSDEFEGFAGTDAGIWIPQLTGRIIFPMPYDIDFRSPEIVKQLCQKKTDYVYVGGTNQSFNAAQFENSEWFEKKLFLPNAQIYQRTSCPSAE